MFHSGGVVGSRGLLLETEYDVGVLRHGGAVEYAVARNERFPVEGRLGQDESVVGLRLEDEIHPFRNGFGEVPRQEGGVAHDDASALVVKGDVEPESLFHSGAVVGSRG